MRNVTLTEADFQTLYAAQAEQIIAHYMASGDGTNVERFQQFVSEAKEHNAIWDRAKFTDATPTP